MQETEPDKDLKETDPLPWWKRILIGGLIGAFFGALNIWFYEFSLRRLLASILSGASYFAIVGLIAVNFGNDRLQVIALSGFAGLVAGTVYWVVAHPSSSPLLAIGIGLVSGIVYAWAETRG